MRTKLVTISDEIIEKYRQVDPEVLFNKDETRPYVGVILQLANGYMYFVPLSSPKSKHKAMKNTTDFHKITGAYKGGQVIFGVLNFNKMIPVAKHRCNKIDFLKVDTKYGDLLTNQLMWIRDNYDIISVKANALYSILKENNPKTEHEIRVIRRSINIKTLEEIHDLDILEQ